MDSENSEAFLIENVDPCGSEREIDDREEEIDLRKDSSSGGEIITATFLTFEIVHSRSNIHTDFNLLETIGEDERVLISIVLDDDGGEAAFFTLKFVEGEDLLNQIGLESARDLLFLNLLDHVNPSVSSAEEEADFGEIQIWVVVGKRYLRGVELETTGVSETEFV